MLGSILDIFAKLLGIITNVLKGDQPKRSEVENATEQLDKENKELEQKLEKLIEEKKKNQKK